MAKDSRLHWLFYRDKDDEDISIYDVLEVDFLSELELELDESELDEWMKWRLERGELLKGTRARGICRCRSYHQQCDLCKV